MKAFIAIAFLAVAAAQTLLDVDRLTTNVPYKRLLDQYPVNVNQYQYGSQYPYTRDSFKTLDLSFTQLTIEELVRHPLFTQYYSIPLFRQHFSHPMFRYYLTTASFQQYWIYPEFQTFFKNPYLFYKYVYPVIYNTVINGNRGIYNVEDILRQQPIYQNPTTVFDKVFRSILHSNPEVTEVKTDIKILKPKMNEQNWDKYPVDPITGEVKRILYPDDILRHNGLKDIEALKRVYLTKDLYNDMNKEDIVVKTLEDKVKEELLKPKVDVDLPILRRNRRHATTYNLAKPYTTYQGQQYQYQQQQPVTSRQNEARSLYYYPVTTYSTPMTYYTYPTYTPTWYYPVYHG